jgi:hypothetical protein
MGRAARSACFALPTLGVSADREVHARTGMMSGVKLQFSTRSLLLATAFVAIACGSFGGWWQIDGAKDPGSVHIYVYVLGFMMPVWLPLVFIGYAIGRKRLSVPLVLIFAVAQALAVGLAYLADVELNK